MWRAFSPPTHNQQVELLGGGIGTGELVQARALLAQLAHLAQNGDAVARGRKLREQVQAGGHGLGRGVVRVVDDLCAALRTAHVRAATGDLELAEHLVDNILGDAQTARDGGGVQGVHHRLRAGDAKLGVELGAVFERDVERRAAIGLHLDVTRAHVVVIARTAQNHVDTGGLGEVLDDERGEVVLAVQHERCMVPLEVLAAGGHAGQISALARAMFSRLPSMPMCEVPILVMTA